MAMYPQPQKKKRPAPAGLKQNKTKPRKSTGGSNPLNRPAPNPTGGVAGGPSAPTRRSKPAGGYAKNKAKPAGYAKSPTKAKPRPGTRPGAKPPTAAQKAYAQQQTAKSAQRAQAARAKARPGAKPVTAAQKTYAQQQTAKSAQRAQAAKAKAGRPVSAKKQPVLKGIPNLKPPKPGTGTAMPVRKPKTAKPKPKTAKRKSPFAKDRPSQGRPRYTTMPVKGSSKSPSIAMSKVARKAQEARKAARKAAEIKKAARVKRTGESLATTAAEVRARKQAAGKKASALARKRRATSGYAKRPSKSLSPAELKRRVLAAAKKRAAAKKAVAKKPAAKKRAAAKKPRMTGGPRRPGMGRRR